MLNQNLEKIFEQLKQHIPSALKVVRVRQRLTKNDLSLRIVKDKDFVSRIENGEQKISFYELEKIAAALEYEVIKILKVAQFLNSTANVPEKEMLKKILQEIEYQLWEREQG